MNDATGQNPAGRRTGTIHVTTNMNCSISLDGKEAGLTEDATFTLRNVPFGRHLLEGATHRHLVTKEIFLSLPELNIRLVLEERGGTLVLETEIEGCRVGIEGENYPCPATINNLKRGVYPITVSGEGFQYTDKVRIQNNQITPYRITEQVVKEKETEAAKRNYKHVLEMPETTLRDRKRKVSALEEILANENRFELTKGIEIHRHLMQNIRQEEFAKETMSKAIAVEKIKKKRKYGLILSILAIILVIVAGTSILIIQSNRNRDDEKTYSKALQSGNPADYDTYLELFGKNAHHFQAARTFLDKANQDDRMFAKAKLKNTPAAFEDYLNTFREQARHRREAETMLRKLKVKQDFPDTLKKMGLVLVPGGSYFMGASPAENSAKADNLPPVWVKIHPFAIGKYEVTFDEYDTFCRETGRSPVNDSRFGREKHPVINVSWNDANAYCSWLSEKTGLLIRLPSESEWEFACRARRMSIFFWGNEMDHAYCVSGRKKRGRTRPVGSTEPNSLGLYDMSGNVYEWCQDQYQDPLSPGKDEKYRGSSYQFFQKYDKNQSQNPVFNAWGNRRVIRGGSYRSSDFSCRSSHRAGALPETKRSDIGFRIAVTIPQ